MGQTVADLRKDVGFFMPAWFSDPAGFFISEAHMAQRVIRIVDLATTKKREGRLPVCPATIWRWVAEGKFPAPFKLGPNTTVWDLDLVEAHLAQQAGGAAK
jgi:prophage regulatory protein